MPTMVEHFKIGDAVRLRNGNYVILKPLGSGSQGEVYSAANIATKQRCAIKFCFGDYASNKQVFYKKLSLLAKTHSPHPAFAWPFDIGDQAKNGGFLYAMPIREGFDSLAAIMRREDSYTDEQRLELAYSIVEAFACLHAVGFLYVDYSQTNIRYRRQRDRFEVAVIDTDNVTLAGGNLGVEGSGLFRPPELMLGGKADLESDYHALAALVFHLLIGTHPLDGKRTRSVPFTPENVRRFWAEEPCFIFNGSGNPCTIAAAEERWKKLPERLRAYFSYIFCNSCLHRRLPRPSSAALLQALS